jgi:Rrf2 family protein
MSEPYVQAGIGLLSLPSIDDAPPLRIRQREPSDMLTRKGKYGLKALVHLARIPPGELALVGDIATGNHIPKKFLDAILGELRNAGFVTSRKGKGGGYRLARAPQDIRIGDVIRTLDGPLAPISCASRTRYERCEDCDEPTCRVRHVMIEVREAIAGVLDNCTLADMRDMAGGGDPALLEEA